MDAWQARHLHSGVTAGERLGFVSHPKIAAPLKQLYSSPHKPSHRNVRGSDDYKGGTMTERKPYKLSELVAWCAPNAPIPKGIRKWEQAQIAGTEQTITQQAIDVITQAIRIWESREQALEWLQHRIPALDNERPCDLLGSQEGCRRIAKVLRNIEQGDFS